MVANIANTIVGLWLTYVAIFSAPADATVRWGLLVAAAVIVLLAAIARSTDYARWQSSTNIVLGVVLFILAAVHLAIGLSGLLLFWVELWIGLAVGIFALWAALYHPEHAAT